MVLEGAANTTNDFPTDSPASDADRYESQTLSAPSSSRMQVQLSPPLYVDINSFPHPIFSSGNTTAGVAGPIQIRCRNAAYVLGRPLNQDEANALCYNIFHGNRIISYIAPATGFTAAIHMVNGWEKLKFPGGWAPGAKENSTTRPDVFLSLRGSAARAAWQGCRFVAFPLMWSSIYLVLFSSVAMTSMSVRDARDPRLREFNVALTRYIQARQKGTPVRDQDQMSTTQEETFEQRRQRKYAQGMAQGTTSQYDDASPTGGAFAQDVRDDYVRPDDAFEPDKPEPSVVARPQPQTRQDDFLGDFEDSSKSAAQTSQTQSQTTNAGGSAWDRLRKQAMGKRPEN